FRMLGLAINIYRGGSDESTAGPYVTLRGCNFEDCCNKERGSVIRAIGPQVMEISGCNFSNSGRGGASIRLDEATWEKIDIFDCNFWNAGRIVTMTDDVVRGGITHDEPRYADAAAFDFRRK
ncbi:MAG: poly(beta-D-mannuronate) lyase, partial [Alistipes sp.]|nr:poly(beta-D-mannuronate) lyase [Alistipes sp.]